MTDREFIKMLVDWYRGRPDEDVISIGHWLPGIVHPELEEFYADVAITVGQLRRMSTSETKACERHTRVRELLEWMDRKGGLGLDVHDRIRQELTNLSLEHEC